VPNRGEHDTNNDKALRKLWRSEQLANCKQVCNTRKRQPDHEAQSAAVAEMARAER
jgi:hypothetical protein